MKMYIPVQESPQENEILKVENTYMKAYFFLDARSGYHIMDATFEGLNQTKFEEHYSDCCFSSFNTNIHLEEYPYRDIFILMTFDYKKNEPTRDDILELFDENTTIIFDVLLDDKTIISIEQDLKNITFIGDEFTYQKEHAWIYFDIGSYMI